MEPVTIARTPLASPEAQALIAALNRELAAAYPEEGANHFRLDADEVADGRGGFFVARSGGVAVGCGALRKLDGARCELKRMFVVPSRRGQGVGGALLARLIDEARALGAGEVVLETGIRQRDAIAMYERAGFVRIAPFGEYLRSPDTSVCMARPVAR
jgi:putative acetyltransferase